MRFIRNEIQTPKRFIASEDRKGILFTVLMAGIAIFFLGTAGFFLAFLFRVPIKTFLTRSHRDIQTYSIYFAAVGILLYTTGALLLKIPLRKTTIYKIKSIVKNEPFDPPKKGDFTKPIYARLFDLNDKWSLFAQVKPPETDFLIPQVIIGPGGVFTTHPLTEHPDRKRFKDPGPPLKKASDKLGDVLGQQVIPIIVFSTPKLIQIYKKLWDPKTRTLHIIELEDYFLKRRNKLTDEQREKFEQLVYEMIQGTAPAE